METVEVEVWVQIDENGDYTVADQPGNLDGPGGTVTRTVKVTLKLPKPKPVEVLAVLDEEPADVAVRVA